MLQSQTQFVDPDGQVLLPPSLSCLVDVWRRPQEVFSDRIPVIVEDHEQKELDLFAPNTHLMDSEVRECHTAHTYAHKVVMKACHF